MIDPRRPGRYARLEKQLQELVQKSPDLIAGMATVCALLHAKLKHHSWTGFYLLREDGALTVGPYQGPVACQLLENGGVCLHCVETQAPVVVPDVEAFPGHVACDSRSESEIVLPLMRGDQIVAVLDIDSHQLAQFDRDDVAPLMAIVNLLQPLL